MAYAGRVNCFRDSRWKLPEEAAKTTLTGYFILAKDPGRPEVAGADKYRSADEPCPRKQPKTPEREGSFSGLFLKGREGIDERDDEVTGESGRKQQPRQRIRHLRGEEPGSDGRGKRL